MPSIPYYNLDNVEEDTINRAKRRIMGSRKKQFSKLQEYPRTDPTDGGAEKQADDLIRSINDLEVPLQIILGNTKPSGQGMRTEFFNINSYQIVVQQLIRADNLAGKVFDQVKAIQSVFNFIPLSKVQDIKGAISKVIEVGNEVRIDMRALTARVGATPLNLSDIRKNADSLFQKLSATYKLLEFAFSTYAEARVQQPLREGQVVGSGYGDLMGADKMDGRPTYRIGSYI